MNLTNNVLQPLCDALQVGERYQWKVGDELLKLCGPPGEWGLTEKGNKGSYADLRDVYDKICDRDFNIPGITWLAQVREIAFKFPKAKRHQQFGFWLHVSAGTPEILAAILKGAPKGQRITQDYIRGIRQRWEERELAKDQRLRAAGGGSSTPNRTGPLNKFSTTPPDPALVPVMAVEAGLISQCYGGAASAKEATKELKASLHRLEADAIPALVEAALKAAEAWREFADLASSKTGNKRGHLQAVS
jgi:hypothetical protein